MGIPSRESNTSAMTNFSALIVAAWASARQPIPFRAGGATGGQGSAGSRLRGLSGRGNLWRGIARAVIRHCEKVLRRGLAFHQHPPPGLNSRGRPLRTTFRHCASPGGSGFSPIPGNSISPFRARIKTLPGPITLILWIPWFLAHGRKVFRSSRISSMGAKFFLKNGIVERVKSN